MAEDFLSEQQVQPANGPKHLFHLHRRLFLLVFAVAVLWQVLLAVDLRLQQYAMQLDDSFKVILTVNGPVDNAALEQMGETLNQKQDIAAVKLFAPKDGLEVLRRQNPQLTEALLLMGQNKMPAYFELKLTAPAISNIRPFVDNLAAEYPALSVHYNLQHAELVHQTGIYARILRLALIAAALLFLVFMFLVEAYPSEQTASHFVSGAVSGLVAAAVALGALVVLWYPNGLISTAMQQFTTPERQLMIAVFCGLFGWTLSKWQKF